MDANFLIFEFIEHNNLKETFLLLSLNEVSINTRNFSGYTPLHFAIKHQRENIVQMLVSFKPDFNLASYFECGNNSPLITAVKTQNSRLVQLVLDSHGLPNFTDNQGLTALHHAAKTGNMSIIRMLVDNGADITSRDNFGFNAAYHAQSCGHFEANSQEINSILGKSLKITSADVRTYREDFFTVHNIEDKRRKTKIIRTKTK